jgi:hypothetical protein
MRKPPGSPSPKPALTDPPRHNAKHPVTPPTTAPSATNGWGLLTPGSSATPMTPSSARSTTDNNTPLAAATATTTSYAPTPANSPTLDTPAERSASRHSMLDHYVHTAHSAALQLNPQRDSPELPPPRAGTAVVMADPADRDTALRWFTEKTPTS